MDPVMPIVPTDFRFQRDQRTGRMVLRMPMTDGSVVEIPARVVEVEMPAPDNVVPFRRVDVSA